MHANVPVVCSPGAGMHKQFNISLIRSASRLALLVIIFFSQLLPIFAAPPPGKGRCNSNLVVVNTQSMTFGSFDGGTGGGTVTVSPSGTRSGSVAITSSSSFGPAVFVASNAIVGCNAFPVRITLPATATLGGVPSGTMTLSTFTSDQPGDTFTIPDAITTVTINIGATLNVGPGQTPGNYLTTTPYTVRFRQ